MERRLAAVMIADVAGYGHLSQVDEEGTRARFQADLHDIFEPKIAAHHGRLVKTMGDGLLVEFQSVVHALRCAIEVQGTKSETNAAIPTDRRLEFRIGINLGDVIVEGDDIHGDGVNIAARLEQLAEAGGICVSEAVVRGLRASLPVGVDDLGPQRLKNIAEPVRAYRLLLGSVAKRPMLRQVAQALPWRTLAAALVVLVVAGAGAWWWSQRPTQLPSTHPGIAVLPFENLGGDDATGRLADGITEDIITDLARFRELDVIGRTSTAVYKGKPIDVREVGKALNVRYALEGSIQRQADRVRVPAALGAPDSRRSSSTPIPAPMSGPSAGTARSRTCSRCRARCPKLLPADLAGSGSSPEPTARSQSGSSRPI
jgi:adenylate cyclase